MDHIVDYLQQLGLSEVEAKLYLTLLQIGPASVRDLAQTIEIKRTTAYFYIDQLVEKGLIMKLVKGSKKLVAANEPENLKQLVEEKLTSAKIMQQGFPSILKTLNNALSQENNVNDADIKYYKGKSGVKKIYEEALQANELRSYVNIAIMQDKLPKNSLIFAEALKNNKKIKMYELIEDSPVSREQVEFQTKNANYVRYFYKFLPKEVKLSAADTLIYDGKVAIINVGEKISGVVLYNSDHFNNSRALFDSYWSMLL